MHCNATAGISCQLCVCHLTLVCQSYDSPAEADRIDMTSMSGAPWQQYASHNHTRK